MTQLDRIECMYHLILALIVSGRKVTVKNPFFSVDFSYDTVYHVNTKDVKAESNTFIPLYDLVKYKIKTTSICEDIEIIVDGKLYAVIK